MVTRPGFFVVSQSALESSPSRNFKIESRWLSLGCGFFSGGISRDSISSMTFSQILRSCTSFPPSMCGVRSRSPLALSALWQSAQYCLSTGFTCSAKVTGPLAGPVSATAPATSSHAAASVEEVGVGNLIGDGC